MELYHSNVMSKLKLKVNQNAGFSDLLNWRSYSSLQKLLTVVIVVIAISWLSSLWTLIVILILAITLGVNLSWKISHRDRGEQLMLSLSYILQECSQYLHSSYTHLKFTFLGQEDSLVDRDNILNESGEAVDTGVSDSEKDVFSDDWSGSNSLRVKVPCNVFMEINSLQLLIVRDFIQSWYSDFSYDPNFLKETKSLLQQACDNIVYSLSCQDTEAIAAILLKQFQVHMGMCMKAKTLYGSHQIHPKTKISKSSPNKKFKRLTSICEAFEREFTIHNALLSDETEYAYLKGIVSMFLLSIAPTTVVEGKCSKVLLIEILTANLMLPLMQLISDPDWLMEKIIVLTSDEKLIADELQNFNDENKESTSTNIFDKDVQCEDDKDAFSSNISTTSTSILLKKVVHLDDEDLHCGVNDVGSPSACIIRDDKFEDVIDDDDVTKPSCAATTSDQSTLTSVEELCETESTDSPTVIASTQPVCSQPQDDEKCEIHGEQQNHGEISDGDNQDHSTSPTCSDRHSIDGDSMDSMTKLEPQNDTNPTGCDKISTLEDSISTTASDSVRNIKEEQLLSSDEIFSSDSYENIELDPQKIISYIPSQEPSGQTPADPTGLSFSKLSSIKNFFVDSFKSGSKVTSGISKPKTLALFSDKISSNLNPLSSKLLFKKGDQHPVNGNEPSQILPQLLVENQPVSSLLEESYESSMDSSQCLDDIESPASVVSAETSPGFFSNFPPFFSKSASQTDLYSTNNDMLQESPMPTPSPTNQLTSATSDFLPKQMDMSKSYVTDDRRIFQDVSIPLTLTQKEFGSNSRYSLYVIEYAALYFTEEGKSVMKSGTVKRRYREFNNLQSRLEGYPTYKKYLKNIKGPKRWPTLPFQKLDKDTVKNRRAFMEKYLQDLIQIEAICNGPDLREFLAYEGDSHIAFVKRSPDVNVLRIDKMLMRGMSEVVDRIKALPNIPQEVMSGLRGRDTTQEKMSQGGSYVEQDVDTIEVEFDFDPHSLDAQGSVLSDACREVACHVGLGTGAKNDFINVSQVLKDLKGSETIREAYQQEIEKVLAEIARDPIQHGLRLSSSSSDADLLDLQGLARSDLSAVVLDFVAQCLQGRDHWICKDNVMTAVKSVFTKLLNSYVQEVISGLTSQAQMVSYLRLVRQAVWPQGQFWSEPRPQRTDAQREATRQQARRCLIHFFPVVLRMMLGEEDFAALIDVVMETLNNERLNRHFLYQVLDILVEHLFPDVTHKDMLHKLLFSRSSAEGYA